MRAREHADAIDFGRLHPVATLAEDAEEAAWSISQPD